MLIPVALVLMFSTLTDAAQVSDAPDGVPNERTWHAAGLLVDTLTDEHTGRAYQQWLPFDWSWNLVAEQDSFEQSMAASQRRVDDLWAVIDTSDHSSRPLPEHLSERARRMLAHLDPDGDRRFDLTVWIRNGEQVMKVPVVEISDDSLVWRFPDSDSRIEMRIGSALAGSGQRMVKLTGEWITHRGDRLERLPFQAAAHQNPVTWFLLGDQEAPTIGWIHEPMERAGGGDADMSRWSVQFSKSGPGAATLTTDGAVRQQRPLDGPYRIPLRGTFSTPTDDFRHLAGSRNAYAIFCGTPPRPETPPVRLILSRFDGADAFLFTATEMQDGTLKGDFWSGNWHHETWTAVREGSGP
ncbi:MAG: hypothetical protein LAT64_11695 [Phycisphaerales bacterium]|nr:hypothetical protein [Planctomycetota bacterium]MCH8509414.1 hypothetical protein [Phycisphaerales bacterium]